LRAADGQADGLGAGARDRVHLAVVEVHHVREEDVGTQRAELVEVLDGPHAVLLLVHLDGPRAVRLMQREAHPVVIGQPLGRADQLVRAEGGVEGHGPGAHAAVETPVVLLDRLLHATHRLVRGMDGQVEWIGPVDDLRPHDDAAPRSVVRPQAGVEELRAAGIEKARGAVLHELRDGQERRVVLVLLGHGLLQGEHVAEVHHGVEVVGEDAAHGVRVADVHVVVAEARRHHHVAGVDDAVGLNIAEPIGLVDARDPRPSIRMDPSSMIRRSGSRVRDKASAVDLEVGMSPTVRPRAARSS
jgi:hypothetical protein